MKNIIKTASLLCVAAALILASCALEEPEQIRITKPLSVADMEFLNSYDALKTYIDRSANPNFILSAGVSLSDFSAKGLRYRLLASNFDQIAPTGINHANIVTDNGAFDFGGISALLPAASEAGVLIYGHALVWHAEQRGTFLNELIADTYIPGEMVLVPGTADHGEKVTNGDFEDGLSSWNSWGGGSERAHAIGEGVDGSNCLKFTNPSTAGNPWDAQVECKVEPMKVGSKLELNFMVKATGTGSVSVQMQNSGSYAGCGPFGSFDLTEEWTLITLETEVTGVGGDQLIFNMRPFEGTVWFDNVSLYKFPIYVEVDLVTNKDFEDGLSGWNSWGGGSEREHVIGEGVDGSNCLKFTNPSTSGNSWDAQVECRVEPMEVGSKVELNFMVKATGTGSVSVQMQNSSSYAGCGPFGSFDLTEEWTLITLETEVTGVGGDQLIFNMRPFEGTVWFDNFSLITLQIEGSPERWEELPGYYEPLPEEEKIEIISDEFDRWIAGIMEAASENVKDWTVINEPMDDTNPTQLRTGVGEDISDSEFYWQDYLGKDYARTAVSLARQYGGTGLKLFVNETNLLNKAKCEALIDMIKYWENDNATEIDGISAQVDLTYTLNATEQKANEDGIVEMFNLLKESDKLIRLSGLNMKITNAAGESINTVAVTPEQQMGMSKYYNFVIRKYFEIIPDAQRYGITLDDPIESTSDVGLWNSDFNRKFTFSGFADGLSGQNVKHD